MNTNEPEPVFLYFYLLIFYFLHPDNILIIIYMHLKVSLWMSAGWADFRSLGAYYDVTAVAAFPHLHLAFLEYFLRLHIVKEGTVTLFVALLDGSHKAELRCQSGEAFSSAVFAKASYISVHS